MKSRFGTLRTSVKKLLFAMVSPLIKMVCWFRSPKRQDISEENIGSILIYGYTGIGNMILFTPAIRAIRKHFPRANITLLVGNNTGCEEVVRGSGLVDEIIEFNLAKASVMQSLSFVRRMRARRFDLLVSDFHGAHPFLALLTVLGSIPYRVGHSTSPGWRNRLDYVYNFKVEMGEDEHEIDRDLRLAYAIGIKEDGVDRNPLVWIGEEDRAYAYDFLRENDVYDKHLIIGVQLGTGLAQRWKQWNLHRYAELCDKLIEDYSAKIVLLGAPNEVQLANYVAQRMRYNPIIAAGKTTIKEAAAIIERCRLCVCNDSGLMHVSAAVGTPVVAIYGPTDYHRTHPHGSAHIAIRKDLPCSPCFRMEGTEKVESCDNRKCLNLITVEDVLQATKRLLPSINSSNTMPKS